MARRPATGMDAEALYRQEVERRLRALESAKRGAISGDGTDTFLRSGDFIVTGGNVRILDNGDVIINGGQLVAGPTTVDASGVQVGSDVVIDSAGLKIDGVLQPALANLTESDAANPTLTTTLTTINEITFTIPSFADEVTVFATAFLRNTATPSGNFSINNQIVVDVGGLDATSEVPFRIEPTGVSINSSTAVRSGTVVSPGATVTCRQNASIDTGTLGAAARLEGLAIVRRTA